MSELTERPAGGEPDAETLIRRVIEVVGNAKAMPLSASVLISKEEVLELLQDALDRLPGELREARFMLREREEYLDKVRRDGDEILEAARVRAERMVQRQEIVREAQGLAQRTVDQARDEARRLRHEAEDYCDQRLAQFEVILDKTIKMVRAGRQKLSVQPLPEAQEGELGGDEGAFFDQDTL